MRNKKQAVPATGTSITGCNFVGVNWDGDALKTVQTVADGLLETSQALHAMVRLFHSQGIAIECLLKIDGKGEPKC